MKVVKSEIVKVRLMEHDLFCNLKSWFFSCTSLNPMMQFFEGFFMSIVLLDTMVVTHSADI